MVGTVKPCLRKISSPPAVQSPVLLLLLLLLLPPSPIPPPFDHKCAACLDLLFIKQLVSETELETGKLILRRRVGLLVGLIRSTTLQRLGE